MPTFVALGVSAPLGLDACVIAVEGPHGRRLRLKVSDPGVTDLLALVHAACGYNSVGVWEQHDRGESLQASPAGLAGATWDDFLGHGCGALDVS